MAAKRKSEGDWMDRAVATVQKNAKAEDKAAIAHSLSVASDISKNWKWMDFIDTRLGTPCLLLEWLVGCRGLLGGRMAKLEALEGVGKSSLCYLFYAMAQKNNGYCWHGESEHAPSPADYIASFGCDATRLLIQQPGSIERAFYAMEEIIKYLRANEDPECKNMIVAGLDSVSGFGSDAHIDEEEIPEIGTQAGLGATARMVSRWFRDRGFILDKQQVVLLATSQLKQVINTFKGPPGSGGAKAPEEDTTVAARPLNFHATLRIAMTSQPLWSDEKKNVGEYIKLRVKKNKLSPKERRIDLHHYRELGFDMTAPTVDMLRELCPILLPSGDSFNLEGTGYVNSPMLLKGKNVRSNREGKEELMMDLYANKPLLMQIREALRIRGFGFEFEKRYTPSQLEVEDLNDTGGLE